MGSFYRSITPGLFSLWIFYKLEARIIERLNLVRLIVNYREITTIAILNRLRQIKKSIKLLKVLPIVSSLFPVP